MTPDLHELVSVEVADVYKAGARAASLRRGPGGVEFRYLPDYLAAAGPAVATSLPLTEDTRLTPAGAVPPFFAGLLPEGRRLSALRHAIKTSADDDLSLLLAVGGDAIGDVQVQPHDVLPADVPPLVEVADFASVSFAGLFARSVAADPDRVGLPGVQEKMSARMITVPVARHADHFILKLNPPEFPGLVENEAFFIDAARESGLPVVEAQLVHDADDAAGLLVRRFDRVADDAGTVTARAVEDGCQVLDRYPADKYAVSSEAVAQALITQTYARPVAARELLRQFAFAYLSGNGDAHAKNFSIRQEAGGEWRVAPAYDLPSSQPYGDTTLALSIRGRRGSDITRRVLEEFGASVGLAAVVTQKLLDDLCDRADGWISGLDALPYDEGRIRKLRKTVEFRRRMLRGLGS
jgi:serine/threonine-protein kinase HipA